MHGAEFATVEHDARKYPSGIVVVVVVCLAFWSAAIYALVSLL